MTKNKRTKKAAKTATTDGFVSQRLQGNSDHTTPTMEVQEDVKANSRVGLYRRYHVTKQNGQFDPRAVYLVLRLDRHGDDPKWTKACRSAVRTLIKQLKRRKHLKPLRKDLNKLLKEVKRAKAGKVK